MTDNELLQWAVIIFNHVLEHETPCTCDEAYTGRGLTAPNCLKCNGPEMEPIKSWLKEYEKAKYADN